MIAELAAINAAYAVIKEVVGNGRELSEVGGHIVDFFSSKQQLEQRVKQSQQTPRSQGELLEEFMALEEARRKEKDLRDFMLIAGRPGLLQDWDRFQQKAAQDEEAERKRRLRALVQEQERRDELMTIAGAILVIGIMVALLFGFVWMAQR